MKPMPKKQTLDFTVHRYFGIHFNQHVWDYLAKESITKEGGYELIDLAHASNHHWRFAGGDLNQQRGAYVIARVYLAVGSSDAAILYAKRCLELTTKNPDGIKDFDYAYASEIMWKCEVAEGNLEEATKHKTEARRLGDLIAGEKDKEFFDKDFNTEYKNLMK